MAQLYFRVGSDWNEVLRLREECEKLEKQLLKMDRNKAPGAVAALETQLASSRQKMNEMVSDAAKAGATLENDFKKKIYDASQGVNDFTQKVITQKGVIKDIEHDIRTLSEKYKTLTPGTKKADAVLADYNAAKKELQEEKAALFELSQQQAEARLSVKKLRDEYALYRDDAKETGDANGELGISFKKAFALLGGAAAAKSLLSTIVQVRGEFQLMDTSIETLLGNKEKADKLLAQIKEYAKISPLELKDVNAATQMMLGFNIEAEKTPRFISAIGDISMGESGKFNSLTLAFSQMSATGKLMGQDLNQMINAGFNPLSIMSEKTGKSIAQLKKEMSDGAISAEMVQQAFIDATEAGGKFYQMSENASKTINGQLSMFQDALDAIFNEMGTKGEGAIISSIQSATKLVENYEKIGKILVSLIATYGAYRTALMLVTATSNGYTLAQLANYRALLLAEKAQKLLNATMLSSPYVLVATLVVGMVTAMWALHDSTTAEEKAQARLNEELEKSKERKNALISKTNELIGRLQDETQTVYAQLKAWKELQEELPEAFGKMTLEEFRKLSPEQIKMSVNVAIDEREITSVTEAYAKQKKIVDALSESIRIAQNSANSRTALGKANIQKLIEEYKAEKNILTDIEGKINDIKESEETARPKEERLSELQSELGLLTKEQGELRAIVEKAEETTEQWKMFGWETILNITKLEGVNKKIAQIQGKINAINGDKTTPPVQNKAYWEKIKKDAETALDGIDSAIKKKLNKGSFAGIDEKIVESYKKAQKELKEASKNLSLYDYKEDKSTKSSTDAQKKLQEDILRIRRETEQLLINLMEEGAEKELTQIAHDYDRKVAEIEKYEKELRDAQGGKLTVDQTADIDKDRQALFDMRLKDEAAAIAKEEKLRKEKADKEAHDRLDYLKAYGDYEEKRLAITEEYAEKIANAENDWQKQTFGKERDEALQALERSLVEESALWAKLFDDADKHTSAYINKTIEELQSLVDYVQGKEGAVLPEGWTDTKVKAMFKDAKDVEAVMKRLTELRDKLNKRNPFQQIIQGFKELKAAGEELETAEEKTERQFAGFQHIAEGMEEVGAAIGTVSDLMSDLGIVAESTIGKIEKVISKTSSYAQTGAQLGGLGGGLIGGVIGLGASLASIFGDSNDDKLNKQIDRYEELVNLYDELIDKQKEYLNSLTGSDAVKQAEEAAKLIERKQEAERKKFEAWAEAGGFTPLFNSKLFPKEIGAFIDKVTGYTADQWRELQKNIELWEKLPEEIRNYGKSVIAAEEDTKQLGETLDEIITGVSFDSFRDGFLSALTDMDSSAEDFADNLEKYLQRAIINAMMVEEFDGRIKALYEKYVDYGSDGVITKQEYDALTRERDGIVKDAIARRDELKELFDWGGDTNFSGLTFDSLKNSLDSLVTSANLAFGDIQESFEDHMRQAVLNVIKKNFLDDAMLKWYKNLEDAMSDGTLSEDDTNRLRAEYENAARQANEQFKAAMSIAGIDIANSLNENTLKGALARASQESIDLLAGQTGAQRVAVEDIRNMIRSMSPESSREYLTPIHESLSIIRDLQANSLKEVIIIRQLVESVRASGDRIAENTGEIKIISGGIAENSELIRKSSDRISETLKGTVKVSMKGGGGLGL